MKKKSNIILGIGLIIYIVIILPIMGMSGIAITKFMISTIISIMLPGAAILSCLKIRLSTIAKICTAYSLGYIVIIVKYFLSEVTNRRVSFFVLTCIVSVISVTVIYKNYKNGNEMFRLQNEDKNGIATIIFLIYLIFNIFAYGANYLNTNVASVLNMTRDMQYWVNNIVALKISWPADNLFMVGHSLNYHYFSSIAVAFLSEVYNIDVFSMAFPLYILTKTTIVVGASLFLLESITTNLKTYIYGNIIMLFTTGIEAFSFVTYIHHMLISPFGFDIGFAYGIFFVSFFSFSGKKLHFVKKYL